MTPGLSCLLKSILGDLKAASENKNKLWQKHDACKGRIKKSFVHVRARVLPHLCHFPSPGNKISLLYKNK